MSAMKNLYILQTGSTFPEMIEKFGDFDEMITINIDGCVVINVEKGGKLPAYEECAGVYVTGSHDMVTDRLGWSENLAKWIAGAVAAKVPYFGICYGHQLLAHAMGGVVDYHAKGIEIGTAEINLTADAETDELFKDCPKQFPAHVIHSQTVVKLPEGAVRLAENDHEPNHAFRIGESAWGVQFHPEFTADIIKAYIKRDAEKYLGKGLNVEKILSEVEDTPESVAYLRRFADYCRG